MYVQSYRWPRCWIAVWMVSKLGWFHWTHLHMLQHALVQTTSAWKVLQDVDQFLLLGHLVVKYQESICLLPFSVWKRHFLTSGSMSNRSELNTLGVTCMGYSKGIMKMYVILSTPTHPDIRFKWLQLNKLALQIGELITVLHCYLEPLLGVLWSSDQIIGQENNKFELFDVRAHWTEKKQIKNITKVWLLCFFILHK